MRWSITKSKMFSQCQRKWYYFEIVAGHRSKDPLRREAYLLKQLQSIYAWRGSIVDRVIEKFIVPRTRSKKFPSDDEVINFCINLMEEQIEFGKSGKHRHPYVTKSNGSDAYCAFYDLEYNGGLDDEKLEEAKLDAITSLKNLLRSNFLEKITADSSHIIAQRSLVFKLDNTTITCTPDLLVFFSNAPPMIIDWKVHAFGNADYWLQLGVYAVALASIEPHRDFPNGIQNQLKNPADFRLVEFQLLKNKQREYSISPDDVADIYDYIFRSCTEMNRLVNGKKYGELDINQFQTARSPGICTRCQFKKLCWESTRVQKLLEDW